MEIVLIVLLTCLNGLFSMSEMAIAASRKARLVVMSEAGDAGSSKALELMAAPTQFLSTVQIGITSIGVLNGIVGEAAFSGDLAQWLQGLGLKDKAASISATAIVVSVITVTTIIFGELVPKRIGQMHPERVARLVSRPMAWLAIGTQPVVRFLSASTVGVLKLLRLDPNATRSVTEDEIHASLEEGLDAGLIEEHEHQMVRNVFHLDDRPLSSLMVPRDDIEWFEATDTVAACAKKAAWVAERSGNSGGHSWYPVCRGGLDNVAGVVSVHHLLTATSPEQTIDSLMLPASFAPETLSGMELLEQFRREAARMVFVVDEYGVVQGVLTTRDLLEAITGELKPGQQTEAWAVQRADGNWELEGLMPVAEFKARLDIDELPNEDRSRYNTVGGLWLSVAGRIPSVGDSVECCGWILRVTVVEGRRIERIEAIASMPKLTIAFRANFEP